MAGPIKIAILANASQAKREFGEVESRGQKLGRVINGGAKVAAAGFALVGVAAIKAGQAAAEDEASQAKLATTLQNAAGATKGQIASTEGWITAQGKALGVADDQLRPALSKLAIATGDVGKAQKAAGLAMNISAGSGKSLESVSAALAKAYSTGNVAALAKFGVVTKDAEGKTKSLSAITSELAAKYRGAAASAAETTAGKQKKLTVQLGELQEQIGAKLLPVMVKLADIGLKAVAWASEHTGTLKVFAAIVVGVGAALIAASVGMKIYTASLILGNGIIKTISAVTKVWAGVQWLLNAALLANPVVLVIVAIVALVAIFVLAWKKSETFRSIVIGTWNAIKAGAVAVFGFLKGFITAVWGAIKTVITTYVRVYVAVVKTAWNAIKAVTSAVWNGIKAVVSAVVRAVATVIRAQITVAKTIVVGAWNFIKAATTRAWNGIKTAVRVAVDGLMAIVRGIKSRVTGVFSAAGSWLLNAGKKIVGGLIDGIGAMIGKVREKLSVLTNLIPDWKGPASRDAKLLRPAGELIIGGLVDGFDRKTPAVRKALGALSREISTFDASPAASVRLSAAQAYADGGAGAREPQVVELRLSAEVMSQLQRGKQARADLDVWDSVGGRTRG